jgi:hypothetical protein
VRVDPDDHPLGERLRTRHSEIVTIRVKYWIGVLNRTISSTALLSSERSARTLAHCSGFSANSFRPVLIEWIVVSRLGRT